MVLIPSSKTVTEHKHLGNGSIILCHNGAKFTADALDTLITTLQDKGYTFVPLSQLIYRDQLPYESRRATDFRQLTLKMGTYKQVPIS